MFFLWSTVIRFNFIQSQGFFFWVQKAIVVTPSSHILGFFIFRVTKQAMKPLSFMTNVGYHTKIYYNE